MSTSREQAQTVSSHAPSSTLNGLSDRYILVEELGTGANGRVVAARDRVLERVVAVKMLIDGTPLEVARFIREARITAMLEHPNIVPLHDLEFPADGQINFVMRRVVGKTLGEAIVQAQVGKVPMEMATTNDLLTLILKVCDALARAHARGVIHQDVKPDNIMLGEHGEVVLVDWGEARLRGESRVGKPSQIIGTPIYMSPEQAQGERADERSDVYCLGASLFHALLLRYPIWSDDQEVFWRNKRAGQIDLPTVFEQQKFPRRLLAIIHKAMAIDAAERYQSIVEFANDLTSFQAGQAVRAYHETVIQRALRWINRHRTAVATTLAVSLVMGAAIWWIWGEQMKEHASWGQPLVHEEFVDDSWRTRWVEEKPGMFTTDKGALVSSAERGARVAYRRRLQTPIAIEYDGEILPDSIPCDLSVLWNEGPTPFMNEAITKKPPGYLIQAGAFTNRFSAIYQQENGERLVQIPFRLHSAQIYHFRVEIDDTRVAMWIDGQLLLEHRDLLPATSGYVALYGYFPGKAFSHVRIWEKGVAEKVGVLAIGDAALQAGDWDLAAAQYQRIADSRTGEAIGEQARYRQGLAELRAGREETAFRIWSPISTGLEHDRVLCHEIDHLHGVQQYQEAARRMLALYQRSPGVRAQLRSQWMRYVTVFPERCDVREALNQYIAVKKQAFLKDTSTDHHYGMALLTLQRYHDIIREIPHEPIIMAAALGIVGRDQELIRLFDDFPDCYSEGLLRLGRYDDVTRLSDSVASQVIKAYIKSGKAAAGLARFPTDGMLLIAAGKAEFVLQNPTTYPDLQVMALLAQGRWQDAAKPINRSVDPLALILCGREAEVDATPALAKSAAGVVTPELRCLLATIVENKKAVAEYSAIELGQPIDFQEQKRWFSRNLMMPFLRALAGDASTWHEMIKVGLRGPIDDADVRNVYGQRLWYATALLRGEIDDSRFLAQPTITEAQALLEVIRGMEAEVSGDRSLALRHYQAFTNLPPGARLLDDLKPSLAIERLVAWRLAILRSFEH